MDKILDRKSFRSQRSLAVVAGMKKTEWPCRTDKSRPLTFFKYVTSYVHVSLIWSWTVSKHPSTKRSSRYSHSAYSEVCNKHSNAKVENNLHTGKICNSLFSHNTCQGRKLRPMKCAYHNALEYYCSPFPERWKTTVYRLVVGR